MPRFALALALSAPCLFFSAANAHAVEIGGVETTTLLANLAAGSVISNADVLAITSVDIQTLTLAELSALFAVLEALRSADFDVAAPLASVADRIAFLEAVAEDRPIPASPT